MPQRPTSYKEGGRGGGDWRRGGGSSDPLPKGRGGGTLFSLDKLFAYQLFAFGKKKKKNIPSAICSQSWAGVGPGAPRSSGSQTQFQNPRQLPPGLSWEAPGLRGVSRHSAAVCTPGPRPPAPARPWTPSRSAHYKYPLPTPAAASRGVRFPRAEERERECEGDG